jgi:hypothetical protein
MRDTILSILITLVLALWCLAGIRGARRAKPDPEETEGLPQEGDVEARTAWSVYLEARRARLDLERKAQVAKWN